MLFETGALVVTHGIMSVCSEKNSTLPDFIDKSLARYLAGDWGELCDEDWEMNELALDGEDRIFAAYKNDAYEIWIITEWDRSVTTILFPEEY